MKRSLSVLFASGLLFLFTGCEVWLFLDDDDGSRSGIDVYADISVTGNSVFDDQRLAARLYRSQGVSWSPGDVVEGSLDSEILNETFKNVVTGQYVLVVWITPDGDQTPEDGNVGWNSAPFSYSQGQYRQFILNEEADWDDDSGSFVVDVPN